MPRRQPGLSAPLRWPPRLWLVSDARNDAALERAIARLPCGSGLIFRHYHLDAAARRARFDRLAAMMRRRGGVIVLAGDAQTARRWGADGFYGPPSGTAAGRLLRLITVHNLKELRQASFGQVVVRRKPESRSQVALKPPLDSGVRRKTESGATLVLISPVFATRTHPGGKTLGVARFSILARRVQTPVIALGGMTRARAQQIAWIIDGWAAIDGLSR
ncbi:thiamine phosphate synthase [Blastomonas sp.]|uniref:thiamine phosphate synthase n=1 Tax=Blastomonas sp. TaxID=1909299 RepID=UPI0035943A78